MHHHKSLKPADCHFPLYIKARSIYNLIKEEKNLTASLIYNNYNYCHLILVMLIPASNTQFWTSFTKKCETVLKHSPNVIFLTSQCTPFCALRKKMEGKFQPKHHIQVSTPQQICGKSGNFYTSHSSYCIALTTIRFTPEKGEKNWFT